MLDEKAHTFMQVARDGSFTKAAQHLYISPVAVMKQINAVEAAIGACLLERSNKGVRLTEAGASVYDDLMRIEALADAMTRKARELEAAKRRTVRVGTSLMRPCRPLMDLWARMGSNLPFRLEIVPFGDSDAEFSQLMDTLGERIDCFVGAHGTGIQTTRYGFLPLGNYRLRISVPRSNQRLISKLSLTWDDLDGETLMLVPPGISLTIDRMRSEISQHHTGITVVNATGPYDIEVFNTCENQGYLLETPEIWSDIHPAMTALPMDWGYELAYGIIYAENPSPTMSTFIETLQTNIQATTKPSQAF